MKRGMAQPKTVVQSKTVVLRSIEDKPTRPEMSMHAETQIRRPRGRLGRDVQAKLGRILQTFYDDVVSEGVPDRFKVYAEPSLTEAAPLMDTDGGILLTFTTNGLALKVPSSVVPLAVIVY